MKIASSRRTGAGIGRTAGIALAFGLMFAFPVEPAALDSGTAACTAGDAADAAGAVGTARFSRIGRFSWDVPRSLRVQSVPRPSTATSIAPRTAASTAALTLLGLTPLPASRRRRQDRAAPARSDPAR